MALRLDPVRLFIADDVGVGKTIKALLIARELIDRGEVRRMAVLCPPYLCDQWEKELREKFNLEAVVIRSSTLGRLERHKPAHLSLYEHYPIQVISIDWVKSDRNKYQFLQFCPELVIVDEAHGAAEADPRNRKQQQRHQLLREIAQDERRHLILLTATPHSGVEGAFRSLLGLLRPEFRELDMGSLTEAQRAELARHFVQRTRKDIEQDWEEGRCFPERISVDVTYALSAKYRELFDRTYEFCSEIVQSGEGLEERKRRVRYWGALALLRAVMSSPAAAVAALEKRAGAPELGEEEPDFGPFIFEPTDELVDDEAPTPPIEEAEATLPESDRRRLRRLARMARELLHSEEDTKLTACVETVRSLLQEGFHPIIWCRYVATAEYVGEALRHALKVAPSGLTGDGVQVTVITGRIGEEERRMRIEAIDPEGPRVLVATDCLSEGINLQEKFTAVLHYDLPWNPNRLEQREGRVDRYGQTAAKVKAVRFFGRDNPVDGAVIDVLLDKAREIHRALGTYVPVPEESESVMEAIFNSLFLRGRDRLQGLQLPLFEENVALQAFHRRWELDAERERTNRTRFAQRALKPEEVRRELEGVDRVLGDPDAVREFVLSAAQRLGLSVRRDPKDADVFLIDVSEESLRTLPDPIRVTRQRILSELAHPSPVAPQGSPFGADRRSPTWRVSFVSPTPEGAEYLGRNHRFVTALARYLLEEALTKGKDAVASRCGVMRTRAVDTLTALLLLRVRYLVEIPERVPLLSEEVLVMGYHSLSDEEDPWLDDDEALRLLAEAKPDANIPFAEKRELVEMVLEEIGAWGGDGQVWGAGHPLQARIRARIGGRAKELEESHKRIRKAVSLRVRELRVLPQFPPDLLGLLVLQPVVRP
ncbi:helicase-related protein [Thermus scotoductus]|nr:helicase-related protein [Thermus scotoductus]